MMGRKRNQKNAWQSFKDNCYEKLEQLLWEFTLFNIKTQKYRDNIDNEENDRCCE